MYKLIIKQYQVKDLNDPFWKFYEYELKDLSNNSIIEKDSINDVGQGIEKATEQIQSILKRKGFIQ